MSAESPSASPLPFNPAMLKWARERRQRTLEDAARKLNTKPENIQAWEAGDGTPSVRQARNLANFYDRAFLEFFLAEPPRISEPAAIPDFRVHRGIEASELTRELKAVQSWAQAIRANALDLFDQLGERPPLVPVEAFATVEGSPEQTATVVRRVIGPSVDVQASVAPADFPQTIRSAVEAAGVLVLRHSSLGKVGVRGICIFASPLPVIVFGSEAPSAQAFTIVHELGHIVLRQSAVSGAAIPAGKSTASIVEDWCNKFAAAYLIPADALMILWNKPNTPVAGLDDDILQQIATTFRTSRHATLIRLVHLGYVEPAYYWGVKKAAFEQEEAEYKSFGRPKYYGRRFRSACGDLYTGLVIEAWDNGVITGHHAAELMGTKSFKHVNDIRREFHEV